MVFLNRDSVEGFFFYGFQRINLRRNFCQVFWCRIISALAPLELSFLKTSSKGVHKWADRAYVCAEPSHYGFKMNTDIKKINILKGFELKLVINTNFYTRKDYLRSQWQVYLGHL